MNYSAFSRTKTRRARRFWVSLFVVSCSLSLRAQPAAELRTARLLSEAREPVRIVCFGDSITGRYYHSGGRRAWPEMLKMALNRLFPKTDVTVFNAGISGNTSAQGLARMQTDVLARTPHLVVIMFGMNDLAYGAVTPEQDAEKKAEFVGNLKTMIGRCRDMGAEAILCTQNPVYPEAAPARPPERVGEFAALIRQTGAELQVPVADIYAEWQALRETDVRAWRLLMSETIHPAMSGHKRMSEQIARLIAGRTVSLGDIPTQQPGCAGLMAHLRRGRPVTMMVPETVVKEVRAMVLRRFPAAEAVVLPLPDQAATLEAQVEVYKAVRNRKPHLVFVSLAPHLLAYRDEENFIRQAAWVVNWALPFSGTAWTAVGVDAALLSQGLTRKQREGAELLREIVRGHDLDWIGSPPGASVKLQDALDRWFDAQLEKNSACDRQSGASQTGEGE